MDSVKYIDKEKLIEYIEGLKIISDSLEGYKWYDQGLEDILQVINSGHFNPQYNQPKYAKEIENVGWLAEIIFKSEFLKIPRAKLYKAAYEQGRLDEWIESTNNIGRYEKVGVGNKVE